MTSLNAHGELLSASHDDAVLTYLLLPYGKPGHTSAGTVTASQGVVTIPENVAGLPINSEHDYKQPLGRFLSVQETPAGLEATVRVADTQAGRDALTLAREGLKTGISVELSPYVTRSGELLSATLAGAALCVRPAFADAQLIASDHGEVSPELSELTEEISAIAEELTEILTEKEDDDMSVIPESTNVADNAAPTLSASTIAQAYSTGDTRLAASLVTDNPTALFAALGEVTDSAHGAKVAPTQFEGQLWKDKTYTPKFQTLLSAQTLTGRTVTGWRLAAGFEPVGDYAGNLTEIPSDTPVTEAYTVAAQHMAGGYKVDRSFTDFGDTEFISSLYLAASNDLAKKLDLKALAAINTLSTVFEGGATPTDVNPAIARIVDGALELIDQDANPTFAVVSTDVYRSMLLGRDQDSLEYIKSSLGLEGGSTAGFRIVPAKGLAADTVIVGDGSAVSFYTLPGSPIRVSALDISHGGFDEALFSYHAIVRNSPTNIGLVKVTAGA